MQIEFTSEEMAFRAEARCWRRANVPAGARPIHSDRALDIREFDLEWQRKQFEAGWAGISWPSEYGGRGVSLIEQLIWHEEYARAGAPRAGRSEEHTSELKSLMRLSSAVLYLKTKTNNTHNTE